VLREEIFQDVLTNMREERILVTALQQRFTDQHNERCAATASSSDEKRDEGDGSVGASGGEKCIVQLKTLSGGVEPVTSADFLKLCEAGGATLKLDERRTILYLADSRSTGKVTQKEFELLMAFGRKPAAPWCAGNTPGQTPQADAV
jgi:hypothetical protein